MRCDLNKFSGLAGTWQRIQALSVQIHSSFFFFFLLVKVVKSKYKLCCASGLALFVCGS